MVLHPKDIYFQMHSAEKSIHLPVQTMKLSSSQINSSGSPHLADIKGDTVRRRSSKNLIA